MYLFYYFLFLGCREGRVQLDEKPSEPSEPSEEPTFEPSSEEPTSEPSSEEPTSEPSSEEPTSEPSSEEPTSEPTSDPNQIDDDEDGYTESEGDCDDENPEISPAETDIPDDGIDQDCDGMDLTDADEDGFYYDVDCDDENPSIFPEAEEKCDGLFNNCSDASWTSGSVPTVESDGDEDGYIVCDFDVSQWVGSGMIVGGSDCDDTDATIYPEAPEIPSDGIDQDCDGQDVYDDDGDGWISTLDCDDTDASLNLDDVDQDGYPTCPIEMCFTLILTDSYGDGWNGGVLGYYEDGILVGEYATTDSETIEEICISGTTEVSFQYEAGEWEEENTYQIEHASTGVVLFFDGPTPIEGAVYSHIYHMAGDCDDTDADANGDDVDQDGYPTCALDCDDNNALFNLDDLDGDGESTCDGDCDDNDLMVGFADLDGDGWRRCASEICLELELIDSWGDGWTDGYVSVFVEGIEWGQYTATGAGQIEDICVMSFWDVSLEYTAGLWEQDNIYELRMPSGEVLFSDGPTPTEGAVFSTNITSSVDCDDHNAQIYPGSTEIPDDGIDQDCDGMDLIDGDLDGYYYDVDCDDTDAELNWDDLDGDGISSCAGDCFDGDAEINLDDLDGDGFSTCDWDCDDSDPTLNWSDGDGDLFSTCGQEICFVLEMSDVYGDGWNGGTLSLKSNNITIEKLAGEGASSTETVCAYTGFLFSVDYTAGNWEEENSFILYDQDGQILLEDGPFISEGVLYTDSLDGDSDCDDTDAMIYPDASDIPEDGIDQDCDGIE
jgi:hypothetical protein